MNRNSLSEMSGRIMHMAARITLNKATDTPMMQELNFDGMNSDARSIVERVQSFGFSSVPLPRDEDKQQPQQQQQQGVGVPQQPKGPAAEGIALFIGGQRNHPVVIAIDDRRHRPMGMKPGENAQYDDQGQMTILRRTGLFLVSLDDDGSGQQPGAVMLKDAEGRETGQSQKQERMVSLRHVTKKKQERGKVGVQGIGQPEPTAAQLAATNKAKEEYKHEGESVNTEVRCTKGRIEFRAGDKVVGFYDVASETWRFTCKVFIEDASEQTWSKSPKNDHGPTAA